MCVNLFWSHSCSTNPCQVSPNNMNVWLSHRIWNLGRETTSISWSAACEAFVSSGESPDVTLLPSVSQLRFEIPALGTWWEFQIKESKDGSVSHVRVKCPLSDLNAAALTFWVNTEKLLSKATALLFFMFSKLTWFIRRWTCSEVSWRSRKEEIL